VGLTVTAAWNIYTGHKPDTTLWGIVVGAVSIVCMWLLVHFKMKIGKSLNSGAVVADAACSRICMWLSLALLLASIGYELTGVGVLDSIGSLVVAWFAVREGKEAFGKAKGLMCCCHGNCDAAQGGNNQMNIVDEVLSRLDATEGMLQEDTVSKGIRAILSESKVEQPDFTQMSELMAFEFKENVDVSSNPWGTYLRSWYVLADSKEYPSINDLTPEMVEYYEQRATSAQHPVMKTRYANLVWEFSRRIAGKKPDIEFARMIIDGNLDIPALISDAKDTNSLITKILLPKKLNRALTLSISIGDQSRIRKSVEAIIAYEDKIAEDDKQATWGFSFDTLMNTKKDVLTKDEKAKLIEDLEKRLERITPENGESDHWAVENIVNRLAPHYRKIGDAENCKRVVHKYGQVFEAMAATCIPAIASAHYDDVRSKYQEYNLTTDAKRIEVILQELGAKVVSEFKTISVQQEIPQELIDKQITDLIDGELEVALSRLVLYFTPKKEKEENDLRETSGESITSIIASKKLHDHDGRLVATIGPIDSDFDGRLMTHISQNMQFGAYFLHLAISRLIEKFGLSKDDIVNLIFQSPIFDVHSRGIIDAGIDAYLNDKHLVAAHLLTPQIEPAFRNLLKGAGVSVLKANEIGGFDYITFGAILNYSLLRDSLGEDIIFYLKLLFTESRGWNVRNNICHGLLRSEFIQKPITDRIMHVLFLLSFIRVTEKPSPSA
jgi:hypothetical protein